MEEPGVYMVVFERVTQAVCFWTRLLSVPRSAKIHSYSLIAWLVNHLPAMQETWVRFLSLYCNLTFHLWRGAINSYQRVNGDYKSYNLKGLLGGLKEVVYVKLLVLQLANIEPLYRILFYYRLQQVENKGLSFLYTLSNFFASIFRISLSFFCDIFSALIILATFQKHY